MLVSTEILVSFLFLSDSSFFIYFEDTLVQLIIQVPSNLVIEGISL